MTPTGLEVLWSAVPAASHYTVFWGTEKGIYRRLHDVSENNVLITGLRKGEFNNVSVTAWNQSGESNYGPEAIIYYDDRLSRETVSVAKKKGS